jgi:hypothetical protein
LLTGKKRRDSDYQRAIVLPLCASALSRLHRLGAGAGAPTLAAPKALSWASSLLLKQPMISTPGRQKNMRARARAFFELRDPLARRRRNLVHIPDYSDISKPADAMH